MIGRGVTDLINEDHGFEREAHPLGAGGRPGSESRATTAAGGDLEFYSSSNYIARRVAELAAGCLCRSRRVLGICYCY